MIIWVPSQLYAAKIVTIYDNLAVHMQSQISKYLSYLTSYHHCTFSILWHLCSIRQWSVASCRSMSQQYYQRMLLLMVQGLQCIYCQKHVYDVQKPNILLLAHPTEYIHGWNVLDDLKVYMDAQQLKQEQWKTRNGQGNLQANDMSSHSHFTHVTKVYLNF